MTPSLQPDPWWRFSLLCLLEASECAPESEALEILLEHAQMDDDELLKKRKLAQRLWEEYRRKK